MKIILPVDGSEFTKKALAFLATHENLCGPDDELLVLNVQPPVPARVKRMLGSKVVNDYHQEEAQRVLDPIERFLKRHPISYSCRWVVGAAKSSSAPPRPTARPQTLYWVENSVLTWNCWTR